ncbi:hypothetical protein FZEAL_5991 [Fusarium zealandicum]|uniref:C6 transcription factor n=1 Tax=Fusarium zealandicum TaxID=1053134 RepID=A0A8H4XJA0_9HYPO|nr:hypothetical protein FZEAL_5991 [Fusarium zealandicum]
MLGLGASHLGLLTPSGYEKAALKHRVTAIKSLNNHLSRPNLSKQDAEAAFGAMLVLTFQSAYMAEGLGDFLTMIRGCWLVGTHVGDLEHSIFKTLARASYIEKVQELAQGNPADYRLNTLITEDFCNSIRRIAPLCRTVPELGYLAHMERIATFASTDICESYRELSFLFDQLGNLASADFASFVDSQNHVSQLVIMHMLVLDFVMSRKVVEEGDKVRRGQAGYDCKKAMSKVWIERMLKQLPPEYQSYAEWPVRFSRGIKHSFNEGSQDWEPFFLSNVKATMRNTNTLSFI